MKVALVTGTSRGVGFEIVDGLVARGNAVTKCSHLWGRKNLDE